MIPIKNRLIFGFIKLVVKTVCKVVYSVITLFSLQYALLVALIGLILLLTGVIQENDSIRITFWIFLALSLFLSVYLTLTKILPKTTKVKRKPKEIVQPKIEQDEQVVEQRVEKEQIREVPKYYAVKQDRDYIMAEYSDRYILYKKTEKGLITVRTDYKAQG